MGLLSMLEDRKFAERENTLGMAFNINRGALGRPAALQAALRDFGVLARDLFGQVDACLLLPHAHAHLPSDGASAAVLAAFMTRVEHMHALVERALTTLVASGAFTRPRALEQRDAVRCFLWLAAHSMPSCKRAAMFAGAAAAPAGASAELEQIASAPANDAHVLRACLEQLDALLACNVAADAPDGFENAQFIIRNIIGAVFTLMRAARDAGTVNKALLAALRAAPRPWRAPRVPGVPAKPLRVMKTHRFGRLVRRWRDPAERGRRKVVIEHRCSTTAADGTVTVYKTLLVVHVPKAALRGTLRELLVSVRGAGDARVREFLSERAARGEASLSPTRLADERTTRYFRLCRREDAHMPAYLKRTPFAAKFTLRFADGVTQDGVTRPAARVMWASSRRDARDMLRAYLERLRDALQHGPAARLAALTCGSLRVASRDDGWALPAADTLLRRFCRATDEDGGGDADARREAYVARVKRIARDLLRHNRSVALTVTVGEPAPVPCAKEAAKKQHAQSVLPEQPRKTGVHTFFE
jgi:uncharacterized protein (DUF2267 family)